MHMNEVQFLRARVEELEEELRQIKEDLCPLDNPFIGKLRLTKQLASLLWVIYKTDGIATNERLNIVVREYGQRNPSEGSNTSACTKVRITHLRNRFRKDGIQIDNAWGVGYYMTAKNKQKLKKMLEKKP